MFRTILCPVDQAEAGFAQTAITVAKQMAQTGASITLVTVIAEPPAAVDLYLPPDLLERQFADARSSLEAIGRSHGLPEVRVRVRYGRAYHEILEEAKESCADLIVMASHRPGFATYLIGSTATHVVRHATCSVLVIREPQQPA
jgi:universal stress protein F